MYFDYANVLVCFIVACGFVVLNVSVISRLARPKVTSAEKTTTYECGEPTIGPAWVRFDMRFYTLALIFLVLDVELAFLYPWAVVFKTLQGAGSFVFWEMAVFLVILIAGFAYVWAKGDLDWVKSSASQQRRGRGGRR
ncbi:MAG: NADH-quinone oxidoreductase subunit A [Planctomycetes bacterium]|nr:NADH-quinone oxidoreductase subunit A [Planctomycetota bacterium]MBI3845238.1 NADH-quinone oxidoreductase subunit A [Planctomycetota bacterium]